MNPTLEQIWHEFSGKLGQFFEEKPVEGTGREAERTILTGFWTSDSLSLYGQRQGEQSFFG